MRALTVLAALALGSMAAPARAAPVVYGLSFVGTEFFVDPGFEEVLNSVQRDFTGTFTFDPVTNQLIGIDAAFTGAGRSFTGTAVSLFNAAQPCNLQCFIGSLESGSFSYRYSGGSGSLTFGSPLSGTAFVPLTGGAGRVQFSVNGAIQVNGAIPEPGTWALMLLGFGAIGASLRRRRTTTAFLAA